MLVGIDGGVFPPGEVHLGPRRRCADSIGGDPEKRRETGKEVQVHHDEGVENHIDPESAPIMPG